MRRASLAGILAAAVLAAGCPVEVEKVDNPRAAFATARAEAAHVQGRPGKPGHLEVLVYDRAEGQLVRASLPMWLVHEMDDHDDIDLDFDEGGEAARQSGSFRAARRPIRPGRTGSWPAASLP